MGTCGRGGLPSSSPHSRQEAEKKTHRSNSSAHPDSAKVIGVQVVVTVEVDTRGSKSHAGPRSKPESLSGHVPRPCARKEGQERLAIVSFIVGQSRIKVPALPLPDGMTIHHFLDLMGPQLRHL